MGHRGGKRVSKIIELKSSGKEKEINTLPAAVEETFLLFNAICCLIINRPDF